MMKVAYVTDYDSRDIRMWSGTAYYIAKSLEDLSVEVHRFGPLKQNLFHKTVRKSKRHYHALFNKKYLKDPEPLILKSYAQQVHEKLKQVDVDVVLSATVNPIAYLRTSKPVVFWADATFANTSEFYPAYSHLCQETLKAGHQMEQQALSRASLAIYSSDWAAQTAIEYYKAKPDKVKVLPFGANIQDERSLNDVEAIIKSRPTDVCKLLFLGVEWFRKGGDVALEMAIQLNQMGLKTELTIVGCEPVIDNEIPPFVKPLGFISKSTEEGKKRVEKLIAESHFLILPSRADCTPIAFSEANSFGVPCLTSSVGGISTIVRDNINGLKFSLDSPISDYCNFVKKTFEDYSKYLSLAHSSFHEYSSRLNWNISGKTLKKYLFEAIEIQKICAK